MCLQFSVGHSCVINRCIKFGQQAKPWRGHGPPNIPPEKGRFWPYLANDPDQIQQPGIIISSPLGSVVQGQKICRRLFGISFRERSYRAPKFTYVATFLDFRDFWRRLACHSSAVN